MAHRGLFITFEGTEGSGKTTQIQRLSAELRQAGHAVCVTREPGGTPISERLREIFLDPNYGEMASRTELLLIAAARAQHVSERIRPALEAGKIVISGRFSDSTVAYQGYRRGLDLDLIRHLNEIATQGLSPDLTFVLDLPVEIGLQRAQQSRGSLDRLEREALESHRRVRKGYLAIARQEPHRVRVVDAHASLDRVYAQIRSEVDRFLQMNGIKRKM
ncbi:MAG: dTMP kinase [Candidatus Poribacteria bacterium]|nr:dTMP kinase [Candidatus Poribacteria bacterium]